MKEIKITKYLCGACHKEISLDNLIGMPYGEGTEYYCPRCGNLALYYQPLSDKEVDILPYPYDD